MTRAQALSDKPTLDRTRDLLNSGFFKSVEAEQLFPHEPEVKELVEKLVNITSGYGFGLSKLTYDEQTAQTDNMLRELEALDLTPLAGVVRWIAPLKAANDAFRTVTVDYFRLATELAETVAASNAALPLTDALNDLFTMLFAHVQITGTDELIRAYKELITQVEAYK